MKVSLYADGVDRTSEFPQQMFDSTWYQDLCAQTPFCIKDIPVFSLSVILVDEKRIRELNAQYRNLNRVTDVLSFAYAERGSLESGEIYLCPSRAMSQRTRFHTTKSQELARLFFHGFLHILGYDHDTGMNRKQMRKYEDCLMRGAHAMNVW